MKHELVVIKSITIKANALQVWQAITNPELTKKYMYNSEVISDWKTGSSITWSDADTKKLHVKGVILNIEHGRYLETKDLSIDAALDDDESNYTRVIYQLREENESTRLEVKEDHFNGDEKRYNDAENFWTTILKRIKELLEK